MAPTTGANVFFENDYGTGAESVDVNTNPTVQSINIDNPTAYTLNNGTITLTDSGGSVGIFVDDANGTPSSPITHTINSAITLANSATIDNMTTGANTNLAINGNISMGGNELTINSDGGGIEIGGSSVISGGVTANIYKTGTGTLTLSSSSANTYGGETKIQAGILKIQSVTALGNSTGVTTVEDGATLELNISGSTTLLESAYRIAGTGSSGQGAITQTSGGNTIVSGLVQLTADTLISSTSGSINFRNEDIDLKNRTLTLDTAGGSNIFFTAGSSIISSSGSIIKTGSGIVFYTSNTANTYGGTTTINQGTLRTAGSPGVTAFTGDIIINGGTLNLRSDNRIADTANMTLNGGILELSSNADETLGTLTLSANSEINFNPGNNHILSFADSSGTSWTGGTQLNIENWEGNATSGGGNHQLIFGSAGLTTAQLAQIKFINPAGFTPGTYAAKFIGNEVVPFVPVPEPSTIITGGLALLFIGYWERRRLAALWEWARKQIASRS